MDHDKARSMLNERVSSADACDILRNIDTSKVEIFGVEGFLLRSDGMHESKLDLMFDVSPIQNLMMEERALFVRIFVENRSAENVYFEIYGDDNA